MRKNIECMLCGTKSWRLLKPCRNAHYRRIDVVMVAKVLRAQAPSTTTDCGNGGHPRQLAQTAFEPRRSQDKGHGHSRRALHVEHQDCQGNTAVKGTCSLQCKLTSDLCC